MKTYGLIWVVCILGQNVAKASDIEAQADQAFRAGNWQAAIDSYELLLAKDNEKGDFWHRLGVSYLNLQQYSDADNALVNAASLVPEGGQRNRVYFNLARVSAATGDKDEALIQLNLIAEAGGTPYLAVLNASEFTPFETDPSFQEVLQRLRPCQSKDHRAFDFWLGQWQVTSPSRPGWQAMSNITLGNDGCSIHEDYRTPGGYVGTSVNFFDASKHQWHQTWIDNQGGPLYLHGELQNGAMVLSDGANRITWTLQSDGRVRQHWQVSNDDGKSYATSFDGYYEKIPKLDPANN